MSENNPAADDVLIDSKTRHRPVEENLKSKPTWMRLVFMILCYALLMLASMVGTFVVVLGFFWVLFTADTNDNLKRFGQQLATYTYEIVRYLTVNTEERPFPFISKFLLT